MNINDVAETGAVIAEDATSTVFDLAPRLAESFFGAFLVAFATTSSTDAGILSLEDFLVTVAFLALGSFLAAGDFLENKPLVASELSLASFLVARARVGFLAAISAAGRFESSFFTISGALQAA
jgi:hypothetical protein